MEINPAFGGIFMDKRVLVELTTEIVSAHASVNEMSREDLLDEIQAVFQKLNVLVGAEGEATAGVSAEVKPAIPLNAAFGGGQVFCMESGENSRPRQTENPCRCLRKGGHQCPMRPRTTGNSSGWRG